MAQQFLHIFFLLLFSSFSSSSSSASLSSALPVILLLYLNDTEFVIRSALQLIVGVSSSLRGRLLGSSL